MARGRGDCWSLFLFGSCGSPFMTGMMWTLVLDMLGETKAAGTGFGNTCMAAWE
jgi:hypothetical protein